MFCLLYRTRIYCLSKAGSEVCCWPKPWTVLLSVSQSRTRSCLQSARFHLSEQTALVPHPDLNVLLTWFVFMVWVSGDELSGWCCLRSWSETLKQLCSVIEDLQTELSFTRPEPNIFGFCCYQRCLPEEPRWAFFIPQTFMDQMIRRHIRFDYFPALDTDSLRKQIVKLNL